MESSWIISIAGIILGLVLGYAIAQRRSAKHNSKLMEERALAENLLGEEKVRTESARSAYEKELAGLKEEINKWEIRNAQLQQQNSNLLEERSRLQALYESLKEQSEKRMEEIEKQEERLRNEFKALANEILKKNSTELNVINKEQLGNLLNPLKEQIDRFEKKVQATHDVGTQRHTQLTLELEKLRELNTKLQDEAGNLTRALKGDSKKQGNWGEVVLERVLEISGLEKGREYQVQQTIQTEGGIARPDVIISLPEGKHLIIDSKVSLTNYESYVSADTDTEKEQALRLHLVSVRNHIRQLSDKKYFQGAGLDTPDFVLLFMPIEPAFSLAMRSDAELFNFAWDKRIVVVSPTTLLATLRTVASIWRHEKQTQNALEIAKAGGDLYDKFVGFTEDLQKIGEGIDRLRNTYEAAQNKLVLGKGNIVRRVEKLRELGAKSTKELPEMFKLSDASENEIQD